MITINLLPPDMRPIKRSPLPYLISVAVLFLAIVVMASMYLGKVAEARACEQKLADDQAELDKLSQYVQDSNDLEAKKRALADKISAIDEIVRDRIIWSRQLWNLSRLAPDNLWFDGISVKTKQFKEQREEYNPQTKKTERKDIFVNKLVLTVSGYVIQSSEGRPDVNPFVAATTSDPEFSALFEFQPSNAKDTEFEGFKVRQFDLQYVVTPQGGATK